MLTAMPEVIVTSRTRLRRPRADDAARVHANWSSDPDVTRYLPWRRHETVADAATYLESLATRWADGSAHAWMITLPPSDDPVGLGLIRFREDEAEIGYSLARSCWGRGFITEVAEALLREALGVPTVTHVIAVLDTENTASARVVEKIGMRQVATFTDLPHPNISDVPRPCFRYAIDRASHRAMR